MALALMEDYRNNRVIPEQNNSITDFPEEIARKERFKLEKDFHRALRQLLTGNEYAVFTALQDRANDKNDGWCWPSYEQIGEDCNELHRNSMPKIINNLEEYGLIEVKRMPKGSHKPDWFRPIITSTAALIEQLKSRTKNMREASHAQKLESSRTKNMRGHAQKLCSNGSNLTVLKNDTKLEAEASSGETAPTENKIPDKRLIDKLREKYQEAQAGNGPSKHKSRDPIGVVGEAFTCIFARAPDYGRLVELAGPRYFNSGWELIKVILKCEGEVVEDDPHDYLKQIAGDKKNGRNRLGSSGKGTVGKAGNKWSGYNADKAHDWE